MKRQMVITVFFVTMRGIGQRGVFGKIRLRGTKLLQALPCNSPAPLTVFSVTPDDNPQEPV